MQKTTQFWAQLGKDYLEKSTGFPFLDSLCAWTAPSAEDDAESDDEEQPILDKDS